LHMIRETNPTAILIEFAFMTNQNEASKMRTAEYQQKAAKAVVEAIAAQYGLKKKYVAPPAPTPAPAPTSTQRHVKIVNVSAAAIMMDKPDRLNSNNIGTIPLGTVVDMIVPVAGYNNPGVGYFKVVYNGHTGYINARYAIEV
jgi:hypothetical protein